MDSEVMPEIIPMWISRMLPPSITAVTLTSDRF